jgi:hypothetical protein
MKIFAELGNLTHYKCFIINVDVSILLKKLIDHLFKPIISFQLNN